MFRRNALAVAALAFAIVSLALSTSRPVVATQGQAVLAGETNTSISETALRNTTYASTCSGPLAGSGVAGCGYQGVYGEGRIGVYGYTNQSNGGIGVYGAANHALATAVTGVNIGNGGVAVEGEGGNGGTGVFGTHTSTTGIGVHGKTAGVGSAVFGEATGNGVALNSETTNGIGVRAKSTNGHALDVIGRARFNRSGTATVNGSAATPRGSVVVNLPLISNTSLILVTPQKNVAGVWVRAAVPNVANNRFTIYLNKNVSQSFPVAWMVIERP